MRPRAPSSEFGIAKIEPALEGPPENLLPDPIDDDEDIRPMIASVVPEREHKQADHFVDSRVRTQDNTVLASQIAGGQQSALYNSTILWMLATMSGATIFGGALLCLYRHNKKVINRCFDNTLTFFGCRRRDGVSSRFERAHLLDAAQELSLQVRPPSP